MYAHSLRDDDGAAGEGNNNNNITLDNYNWLFTRQRPQRPIVKVR